MTFDFTKNKYRKIIETIVKSDYSVFGIKDYLSLKKKPKKTIILRHDVDMDPFKQIEFAKMENNYGISVSYYFRHLDHILNENIINEIYSLKHEIGYHYEVLTKARGDFKTAIKIFREELDYFQKNWNTVTVCPHGGAYLEDINGYSVKDILKLIPKLVTRKEVFSKWNNADIWNNYNIKDFNLIGDAYNSFDFYDILYLSDTGRSWDESFKRKDKVNSSIIIDSPVRKSDDIIEIIEYEKVNIIYLLVHFEQWKDNIFDWLNWYAAQLIRRNGKKLLKVYK